MLTLSLLILLIIGVLICGMCEAAANADSQAERDYALLVRLTRNTTSLPAAHTQAFRLRYVSSPPRRWRMKVTPLAFESLHGYPESFNDPRCRFRPREPGQELPLAMIELGHRVFSCS